MLDPALPDPLDPNKPQSSSRPTSHIALETAVVFLVCVLPNLFNSTALLFLSDRTPTPFLYQYLAWLIQCLAEIGLVLYIIHRSCEPFATFGLKPFHFRPDVLGAVATFALGIAAHYGIWILLSIVLGSEMTGSLAKQNTSGFASSSAAGATLLILLVSVANGFAEELIVRAYFIPRFERLFSSTPLAILLSTAIFASYHTYQGTGGVISITALGLVYGLIFSRYRRLWPLAIAHALADLLALTYWIK